MNSHQIRLTARDIMKNCLRLDCRNQSVPGIVRDVKKGYTFREGLATVAGKVLRVFEVSNGQWEVDYGRV